MRTLKYVPATQSVDMRASEVLRELTRLMQNSDGQEASFHLVHTGTEELIEIPIAAVVFLRDILESLVEGKPTTLISANAELTDLEAADILNVSRQYLVKLLENGEIPHTKMRSLHRIRMDDLMAYKEESDKRADKALDELVALSEELGLYDL